MADHSYNTPTKDRPVNPAGETDFPQIQGGRYQFIEIIGSGGAGTVYRALDTTLDKHVAIKKLHDSATDQIAVRFQREARLAGSLNHRNVMAAKDFGLTSKNEPYLILDFVEGESLSRLIRRGGPLPVGNALEILIQIASGLAHAHLRNVIHRDVKPSNVMLVSEKDPNTGDTNTIAKIVDFGLAKALDEDQVLTKSKTAIGTPNYMSPEQLRGVGVDQRSDIYSFGCLMFQVLTGEPPFTAESALDVADMHMNAEIPTLASRGVEDSAGLERIVNKCLRKEASDRYQTFEGIQSRLEYVFESDESLRSVVVVGGTENEAQSQETDSKTSKTGFQLLAIVSGVGLVVILLAVFVMYTQSTSVTEKKPKKLANKGLDNNTLSLVHEFENNTFSYMGHVQVGRSKGGDYIANAVSEDSLAKFLKEKKEDTVSKLDVSNSRLSLKSYKRLNEVGEVRYLLNASQPINRDSMKKIAAVKTLEIVQLGSTTECQFDSLSELRTLPHLYNLEIHGVQLNENAFKQIAAIPQLEIVNVADCTGVTPAGLRQLEALKKLTELKLAVTDVDDKGIEAISTFPKLKVLNVTSTKVADGSAKCFARMKSLRTLIFQNCSQFPDASIFELARQRRDIKLFYGEHRLDKDALGHP